MLTLGYSPLEGPGVDFEESCRRLGQLLYISILEGAVGDMLHFPMEGFQVGSMRK